MAHAVDSRASSPANALRDALDLAEDLVVKPNPQNVEELLLLLDRINLLFAEVAQTGADLRPELVRWEGIRGRISSRPEEIASAASRAGGMTKLRAAHPPADQFWWHLDKAVAERRRKTVTRLTITLGSIIGVVLLVFWVLETFFPPSPETLIMLDSEQNIDEAILTEDWEGAREVVRAAQEQLPNEPELWLWDAVLSEQMDDDESADTALERAQELLADNELGLWLTMGNQYLRVGNIDGAENAAQRAVELDPEEAQGYFLLANVAELQGDTPRAIDMFEKTFELAEESNPQLAVISRVRMGTLLQSANPFASPEATPGVQESPVPTTTVAPG